MSSLLLRKTLNHVCVEGRGTRYATTVSRKYDADTDLDPSMEISCRAPQALWQPTCYGGRRNSCSSYHWKRWQWRELSLAKGPGPCEGAAEPWASGVMESHGVTKHGSEPSSWSGTHWSRGEVCWGLREGMYRVSHTCVHTPPCTNTYLCSPCAWYSSVRAWDTGLYVQAGCDKSLLIQ